MSIRKQVFFKRIALLARHDRHLAMMRLLVKGIDFEHAANIIARGQA